MVEDFLLDMEDSSGPMWLQAWRCMNCGNVSESVLQRNRMAQGTNNNCNASSGKREIQATGMANIADLAA
jgi:hypothetical protein